VAGRFSHTEQSHPDREHELRGFFQSVCLKGDMPYPEWGPKILVAHLIPPDEAYAPNGEVERPRRSAQLTTEASRPAPTIVRRRRAWVRGLQASVQGA
jgi:hypothetical protein